MQEGHPCATLRGGATSVVMIDRLRQGADSPRWTPPSPETAGRYAAELRLRRLLQSPADPAPHRDNRPKGSASARIPQGRWG